MKLSYQIEKRVCIISIEDKVLKMDLKTVTNAIMVLLEEQHLEGLLINCEKVHYIDSSGIGVFIALCRTLKKHQRKVALTHLNEHFKQVSTITKLDKIVDIYSTKQEALTAFDQNIRLVKTF